MIRDIKYAKYYVDNETRRILKIDKGFTDITGYDIDYIKKNEMTIVDLIPEENRTEYYQTLINVAKDGEAYLAHAIKCKSGEIIQVHCYGEDYIDNASGHSCAKILITDVTDLERAITELKKKEEELENTLEKVKFLAEYADEIFVDYDVNRDFMSLVRYSGGKREELIRKEKFLESNTDSVPGDQYDTLRKILDSVTLMEKKTSARFKAKLYRDKYVWYRMIYAVYNNPNTGNVHIIGRMNELDKDEENRWNGDGKFDEYTGLYSYEGEQAKVDEILSDFENDSRHILMLVKINDFEKLKEKYADTPCSLLIKAISGMLNQMFRQDFDIIGRTEEDTFCVLVRNTRELIYIEEICKKLWDEINENISKQILKEKNVVTISIGIATVNLKTKLFKNLYNKAKKALNSNIDIKRGNFGF